MKSKDIIKLGVILLLICGISTGALAFVNSITEPVITKNNAIKEEEAKKEVLSEALTFTKKDDRISIGKNNDEIVGYTVMVAPKGYGGAIEMMVGIKKDKTISGVKILSMAETPGLGAKAKDQNFINQFIGKNKDLNLKKSAPKDNEVQAITGATITSTAVVKGVKEALTLIEGVN